MRSRCQIGQTTAWNLASFTLVGGEEITQSTQIDSTVATIAPIVEKNVMTVAAFFAAAFQR